MGDGKIQWHPAFCAAMQIELKEEKEFLAFEEEHLLGKKPLQIDLLIIKKADDVHIRKSIGHIFRRHNVIEYKSPEDYVSEDDFYKLCAYGCLYKYNAERVGQIPPEDITLTFICDHFPRNMVRHIESKLKFVVKRYAKGVYYIYGGMFRMQIVVGRQLPKGEYFWLKWLRNDIMAGAEIKEIVKNYGPNKSLQLYQAVMNVIMRANWKQMEVEKEMCEALRELFAEELKESELRGELRGKLHGELQGINLAKKVFRLHEAGYSIDEIAKKCDIDVKKVEEILA